ncbi:MAG TPA: sigma-70 family RNA polymerase sigma factor [Gemmatimonadales bacterium]|nr:sigma-70 family RNA polymerase sigma factor [Gemmatimonadales bacterium]
MEVRSRWGADNAALVTAHLAGDGRAFQKLVDHYRPRLLNFVHRIIGDRERAEDLVQEAFIRVYRHLHRFDTSKKFSTWIYTIASNLARNELRNRRRSPLVLYQSLRPHGEEDQRPLQFEDARSRPDDMYAGRYLRELVEMAVATLAPHHREVFVMRELEGRSYEEIAERTRCHLGTVKSRLNRARRAFAERIAPFLD